MDEAKMKVDYHIEYVKNKQINGFHACVPYNRKSCIHVY